MEAPLSDLFQEAVTSIESNSQLLRAEELTGGVSALVYRLDFSAASEQTRSIVFRQHRNPEFKDHDSRVAAKEFALLECLYAKGFAVPEPYHLDDVADSPFFISEWVEGSTTIGSSDLSEALEQMAQFLVQLHLLDPAMATAANLELIENPWLETAKYLPETEAGEKAKKIFAAKPTELRNPPAIIHGDYWPGNLMWNEGKLVAVLDWEDACLGDPLADVATAKVELQCQYGSDASDMFTDFYLKFAAEKSLSLQLAALPVWETYVSAAALSTMGSWGLAPEAEAKRRKETEHFFNHAVSALASQNPIETNE